MKIALFALALLLGALYAYGDGRAAPQHTLGLKARQEGRYLQATVRLPQIDPSYRWLGVRVCAAEWADGQYGGEWVCVGWARESTVQLDGLMVSHFFEWRDPQGSAVLVTAQAFGSDGRVIASASRPLFLKG